MEIERLGYRSELDAFKCARNDLVEGIGEYILEDNIRQKRSGYSTGGMILFQITFFLKCLYNDQHHKNNKREDLKMKYKYRRIQDKAMDYLATLDYIDHSYLEGISGESGLLSSHIIDSFERELINHIDLKHATNRRKNLVSEILEK